MVTRLSTHILKTLLHQVFSNEHTHEYFVLRPHQDAGARPKTNNNDVVPLRYTDGNEQRPDVETENTEDGQHEYVNTCTSLS